jgi:hypothetical protein
VEAVDEKPEELVSGAEARTALVTEGDLELLAEARWRLRKASMRAAWRSREVRSSGQDRR